VDSNGEVRLFGVGLVVERGNLKEPLEEIVHW